MQTFLKPIQLRRVTAPDTVRIAYEGTTMEIRELILKTIDPRHW